MNINGKNQRMNDKQKEAMFKYIEKNVDFAFNRLSKEDRDHHSENLAALLNPLGSCFKLPQDWRKGMNRIKLDVVTRYKEYEKDGRLNRFSELDFQIATFVLHYKNLFEKLDLQKNQKSGVEESEDEDSRDTTLHTARYDAPAPMRTPPGSQYTVQHHRKRSAPANEALQFSLSQDSLLNYSCAKTATLKPTKRRSEPLIPATNKNLTQRLTPSKPFGVGTNATSPTFFSSTDIGLSPSNGYTNNNYIDCNRNPTIKVQSIAASNQNCVLWPSNINLQNTSCRYNSMMSDVNDGIEENTNSVGMLFGSDNSLEAFPIRPSVITPVTSPLKENRDYDRELEEARLETRTNIQKLSESIYKEIRIAFDKKMAI